MPVQHHKKTFSVGANDKKAGDLYRDRYAHSMGKCDAACNFCTAEEKAEKCISCGRSDLLLADGSCVICDYPCMKA